MKLPHRFSWLWLLAAIAVIAVLAFAACEDDEGGGETPAAGESPTAGERIQGGDLISQQIEFDSIDPHYSAFAQDISVERMLWRGLYNLNPENVPDPEMAAADPEITNDGKTYT